MTDLSRLKANFRQTKPWRQLRERLRKERRFDQLTGARLSRQYELHHMRLTDDMQEYKDLSDPEMFMCLNNLSHKSLHWAYEQYQKDPAFLDRFNDAVRRMDELSKQPS